jgi:negative regulator of genetic competence, sporulation and motility
MTREEFLKAGEKMEQERKEKLKKELYLDNKQKGILDALQEKAISRKLLVFVSATALAKDQYKKENEELERLQKAKQVRDKRAEQKAKAVKIALEAEKEKRLEKLEKQKANPDDVFEDLGITKK